jgi:cytochrome P450 family 142 subfamily A polypeptide 1
MTLLDDARAGNLDLLDGGLYTADHTEVWRHLRDRAPLYRDKANGLWAVTRHGDVVAVEKDAATFCSGQGFRPNLGGDLSLISQDDPLHARRRRLVARRFTPRAVAAHEAEVRAIVRDLLEPALRGGAVDVVERLAAPLPAMMITRLLGWPNDHWTKVKSWSERTIPLGGGPRYANDDGMAAVFEYAGEAVGLIADKRAHPTDDVMSVLCSAELDGRPLGDDVLVAEGLLLIDGGAETTRTVIAHTIEALAAHPDQQALLRAEPALIPGAVEEFIRWTTPIVNMRRTATRAVELHGTTIEPGDEVLLCYVAANRDERVFDDPDRFDVTRTQNHHVAFGFGTHFCLGASLARLEIRVFFEELLSRTRGWELAGPVQRLPNAFVRGIVAMPVAFERA